MTLLLEYLRVWKKRSTFCSEARTFQLRMLCFLVASEPQRSASRKTEYLRDPERGLQMMIRPDRQFE